MTKVTFQHCSTDCIIYDRRVEKRKTARKKMVVPVKFSVATVSLLAHTLDITRFGARLGALRAKLQPGTIIELQRGQKKAKFRIVLRLATSNYYQLSLIHPQLNVGSANQRHPYHPQRFF